MLIIGTNKRKGICMSQLVGRRKEQENLLEYCCSQKAELVCIYGRRRVGKTFLIESTFRGRMAFSATASEDKRCRTQLRVFHEALHRYGCQERTIPQDWFEAFGRLRDLLERHDVKRAQNDKRVVFLDEFPWFATKRSDFLYAFGDFWNGWACSQDDLMVIVCGSATSWIVKIFLKTLRACITALRDACTLRRLAYVRPRR